MLAELKRLLGEAWKSEEHARELNAAAVNALPRLIAVCEAAKALCESGYDGPFMGEHVRELFSAVNALEEVPRG